MKVVYIVDKTDEKKGISITKGTIKKYSDDVAEDLIRSGLVAPVNDKSEAVKKQKEEDIFEDIFDTAKKISDKGILFDDSGVIWKYDEDRYAYKFIDKTDVQNVVAEEVNIFSALNPLYRVAFENAIKMTARDRARVICKDAETKYKYCVQFKDTLYNGITLEQKKVTQDDFVHNSIPFSPVKKETPNIDKLFDEWTQNKKNQLKDIIAYSCIPNNTQKLIFFYLGQRNSGKSQFMGVMKRFLGEHNCVSTNLGILANQEQRFELVNLRNKLAAFVSEIDEKTTYNTAMLKRLSGNDDLRGEYKGINGTISFRFGGKVHIITNSLPTVADENDYAYFARTVIIDFPNTFPNSDIEALDSIPNEEYEGLAHYCLERIKEWYQNKKIEISDLEPVDLRAKKYLKHTDMLGSFVSTHMEMEKDFESETEHKITTANFASMFNEYLSKNGQKEWDVKRIGRTLMEKYPKMIERHKRRFGETIVWEYRGIKVKPKQTELNFVADVPDVADLSSSTISYNKRNLKNGTSTTSATIDEVSTDLLTTNQRPSFPLETEKIKTFNQFSAKVTDGTMPKYLKKEKAYELIDIMLIDMLKEFGHLEEIDGETYMVVI